MPREEWAELEQLFEKVQEQPKKYLKELITLYERFPSVFEIVNLLTFAYLKCRKQVAAEKLIGETYKTFPNSLIAKINYADQLLRTKHWRNVLEVFNYHTDLNTLYPEREKYHYAEFRGFMTVMGFYHVKLGDLTKAQDYLHLAFQVDPLHPSIALLEKAVKKSSPWRQKLARIFKMA